MPVDLRTSAAQWTMFDSPKGKEGPKPFFSRPASLLPEQIGLPCHYSSLVAGVHDRIDSTIRGVHSGGDIDRARLGFDDERTGCGGGASDLHHITNHQNLPFTRFQHAFVCALYCFGICCVVQGVLGRIASIHGS